MILLHPGRRKLYSRIRQSSLVHQGVRVILTRFSSDRDSGPLWRWGRRITAACTIVYLGGAVVAQLILKLAYVAITRD